MSISASLFMFIVAYVFFFHISAKQRKVSKRISKLTEKPQSALYSLKNETKKRKIKEYDSKIRVLDVIGNELLLANIIVKPEEYLAFWLFVVFVPASLVVLFTSRIIPALLLVLLGIVLPPVYIKKQQKKYIAKFESQLGDALMVMCNCIRSGLTFQQALEISSDQMDEPISKEFGRVVREIRYGNSLEKALNNMVKRVGSVDLMLAVSAVNIQKQTGGNLSVILENISATIKERQKIKDDIRVLTATGRISGAVIGMLPIGIGAILLLLDPEYIQLFFQSKLGIAMLATAVIMELIGFMIVKKIVTVKY